MTEATFEHRIAGPFELLLRHEGRVIILDTEEGHAWTGRWTPKGRGRPDQTLYEWLVDSTTGYLAGKMKANNYFDAAGVVYELKEVVRDLRRSKKIEAEEARDAYDRAEDITDESSYGTWVQEHGMYEHVWEMRIHSVHPRFALAVKKLLQPPSTPETP